MNQTAIDLVDKALPGPTMI